MKNDVLMWPLLYEDTILFFTCTSFLMRDGELDAWRKNRELIYGRTERQRTWNHLMWGKRKQRTGLGGGRCLAVATPEVGTVHCCCLRSPNTLAQIMQEEVYVQTDRFLSGKSSSDCILESSFIVDVESLTRSLSPWKKKMWGTCDQEQRWQKINMLGGLGAQVERGEEGSWTLPATLLMLSRCQVGCSAHTVLLSPVMQNTWSTAPPPTVTSCDVAVILGWERAWSRKTNITVLRFLALAGSLARASTVLP